MHLLDILNKGVVLEYAVNLLFILIFVIEVGVDIELIADDRLAQL